MQGERVAVRRGDDDELCGWVAELDEHDEHDEQAGTWRALTVFGAELGAHADREAAEQQVLTEGLAALTERWTLRRGDTGDEQIVCITEANSTGVTLALDYYSMPGVPTLTITTTQLAAGEYHLTR